MYKSLTTILNEAAHESFTNLGFKTGYPSLDSILGDISASDLVLITAKVGNWSSILMLNLAVEMSSRYHVLLINTTKNAPSVAREIKSVLLPENESGNTDEDALNDLNQLASNIFIEVKSSFLADIEQAISGFRSDYPVDGIVLIDDLNNIFISTEIISYPRSRVECDIAMNLKMLTLKYNIPVLLLAKIGSPDPVKRKDPPALSDLDHLIGLNCPFNKIIGVHLSGYCHKEEDRNLHNKLFLNILRNDNGTQGVIGLTFSESNRYRFDAS
jgi:replicative DNA helicase